MQMSGNGAAQRKQALDLIDIRRNPYLVDYEEQRELRSVRGGRGCRSEEAVYERNRRYAKPVNRRSQRYTEAVNEKNRRAAGTVNGRTRKSAAEMAGKQQLQIVPVNRKRNAAAVRRQRRRQRLRRRMAVGEWMLCGVMICCLFVLKQGNISQAEQGDGVQESLPVQEEDRDLDFGTEQGIPAVEFAKHPVWTEDFLPVNEYSRPGEALPEVNDIFVHYTANPGTSAAQNHSYFEQQKDMHEASVSAHFIIGYDGEILQCVPLDEIAYAVQTRNYDSVSIECCYVSDNGSFTQATYDSLISLLAWLTDVYGLDTDHILRHYDCGGKKCPIYYTENEDAWERLKNDVMAVKGD